MILKKCSRCKIEKTLDKYHKHVGRKLGVTEYCKDCRNIKMVSKRFNITEKQLVDLQNKQELKCAICQEHKSTFKKGLSVDHCHKTGKIRGMLCSNCNNGLGRFHDSIEKMEKAIKYLKENI